VRPSLSKALGGATISRRYAAGRCADAQNAPRKRATRYGTVRRWRDRAWLGTVVPVYSMDVRRSTYEPCRIFRAFEKQDHFTYEKTFERPNKKMRDMP